MPVTHNGIQSHVKLLSRHRGWHSTYGARLLEKPEVEFLSSRRQPQPFLRNFSTSHNRREVKNVAILGGGITGLAAAHYITEEFPNSKVTIFERQPRLGGWLRSSEVDVGNGKVIFESGPRSLRLKGPNGLLLLQLIESLNLIDDVLVTPRSSPAAQNRFLYYPDSIVRLVRPGHFWDSIRTIFFEPAFEGAFRGVKNEVTTPSRNADVRDESIGAFITRRGDASIANNLVSAVYHGIYAGDIWRLSARTLLSLQWEQELRCENLTTAAIESAWYGKGWQFCDDLEFGMAMQERLPGEALKEKVRNASVISFSKGLGMLTERLVEKLTGTKNVDIRTGEVVDGVESEMEGLKVTSSHVDGRDRESPPRDLQASHVISTLPPHTVPSLLADWEAATSLPFIPEKPAPAVTVAVVNLYFRTPSLLTKLHPPRTHPRHLRPNGLQGFGYLIPRSVPFSENPERALGVIFDSDITPMLHSTVPSGKQGTRLTVMLGGHWWDDWADVPGESDCVEMARSVLQRHLGIKEVPVTAIANIQRNCIPQYHVGHGERMRQMHEVLAFDSPSKGSALKGRLRVAGSWYSGVGVNDCLRSAWHVVQGLKQNPSGSGWGPRTGLDSFADDRRPMAFCESEKGVLKIMKLDKHAEGGRFPRLERGTGRSGPQKH